MKGFKDFNLKSGSGQVLTLSIVPFVVAPPEQSFVTTQKVTTQVNKVFSWALPLAL